jgi:hypothetical protein
MLAFVLLAALAGPVKGMQDGWAVGDDLKPILTAAVARTMKSAGAKWVRLHFRLSRTHKSWDEPLLAAYAVVVRNLEREHLRILGNVTYESHPGTQRDWIENSAEVEGGDGDNRYLRTWADQTLRTLLHRFPTVTTWEIWNEPNCWTKNPPGNKQKLPGQFYIYPSNFAQLLKHAKDQAEEIKPARALVSGGLLGADFTGNVDSDVAGPYLRATFAAGVKYAGWNPARPPVDDWGIHFYVNSGGLVDADKLRKYADGFLSALDAMDVRKPPVWVTEIGWEVGKHLDEARQAEDVKRLFGAFRGLDQFGPVFWFKLTDGATSLHYGLLRADGTPKPSFEAFASGSF